MAWDSRTVYLKHILVFNGVLMARWRRIWGFFRSHCASCFTIRTVEVMVYAPDSWFQDLLRFFGDVYYLMARLQMDLMLWKVGFPKHEIRWPIGCVCCNCSAFVDLNGLYMSLKIVWRVWEGEKRDLDSVGVCGKFGPIVALSCSGQNFDSLPEPSWREVPHSVYYEFFSS